jgi:hypothetical protein
MSVIDLLLDLFRSDDQQAALADDPTSFLDEHAPEGLSAEDILAAMPGVCAALPPEQAESFRVAYGLAGPGGAGHAAEAAVASTDPQSGGFPPPPAPDPGGDPVEQVLQQLNYFSTVTNVTRQSFEDNDVTQIDDRDTTVDQSVSQNITAFGDVNQDFDQDVVSGDGAVAAGDGAQVSTGDGAVQAGGDISDATIATGDVGGSVTGDVSDSVVGDGNQVIDDSIVGAASFGEGDATNVEAENALLGDGTLVDGGSGDITLNQGEGDVTQIDDSTLSESVVGDGTVQSNDVAIDAGEGGAVAFGEGSTATAETQETTIDGNYGTVQVADDATQTAQTDNSVNDSGNTSDSFNTTDASVDNSYDVADSFNDSSDHSVDNSIEDNDVTTTTVDVHDNDGIDIL